MEYAIVWLIILAILLIIEMMTMGLTTIWFAGGSLIAFIVSLFVSNIWIEAFVFFAVSIVLLIFTRPIAMRYFTPKRTKTNYESIIGKEGIVTTTIDNVNGIGRVVVDGVDWSAKSVDGEILVEGTKVFIEAVQGVKVVVSIERKVL